MFTAPGKFVITAGFGGTPLSSHRFLRELRRPALLYALTNKLRRHESEQSASGKAGRFVAVIDETGVGTRVCAMDLPSMEVKTFSRGRGDFLTGGIGAIILGARPNSVDVHGVGRIRAISAGCWTTRTANVIQVHPDRDSRGRQLRLMSESARGEAGDLGPAKSGGKRAARHSRSRAIIFWKSGIRSTGTWCRAISATRAIHRCVSGEIGNRRTSSGVLDSDATSPARRWPASSKGFWRFTKSSSESIHAESR